MDLEKIQEAIDSANNDFRDNSCSMCAEFVLSREISYIAKDSHVVKLPCDASIDIDGDWKHEHGYADYVMSQHGFHKVIEREIGESEDDWYHSMHFYKYVGK